MNGDGGGLPRRDFLALAGMAGAATLLGGCGGGSGDGGSAPPTPGAAPPASVPAPTPVFTAPAGKLTGDLRILMWSHAVPAHDVWFDQFAKDWGARSGVNVTVDHVPAIEIPARASAEIQVEKGHDLIQFIGPIPQFSPSVVDLKDVADEAARRHGTQLPICLRSSQTPPTGKHYAYSPAWAPDPGNFRTGLWSAVGMPNGPATYDDLLQAGSRIKAEKGVGLGWGLSQELDSNLACRALLWSFGASIQDTASKVVINSPEAVAAVEYMVRLYKGSMTQDAFAWTAASNNQGLTAGQMSYVVESVSALRAAQEQDPRSADDIAFVSALRGPKAALAAPQVMYNWIVPTYAKGVDAAKEFLLHYTANLAAATYASKLHDLPAFPSTVPSMGAWLDNDPFGAKPATKLAALKNAAEWSTNIGHPGLMNAAEGEVLGSFVIPNMFAKACREELSPAEAVADAERQIKPIFDRWRVKGLVAG